MTNPLNLLDATLLRTQGYVNGKWIDARDSKTFGVTNPSTGNVIVNVADFSIEETRYAIDCAEQAGHEWKQTSADERYRVLKRWHGLMIENTEDLAKILTAEMGKPLAESKAEISYGASFIEWFAEEAKRIYGETIPGHQRDKRITVIKQPVGVVASITPWNFPNAMITRKVAPAIAAGCSVVAKPAEETPLSAIAMGVLAERAGFPKGLFNIIPTTAAQDVGQELCANTKVRKLTFTGSTQVGRILMQQCGANIKKLSLELGGNAPFIVFEDADLDDAVDGAMLCKFRNNGQTCVCANRIYVQDTVYDAFAEKLGEKIKALKVGDGLDINVSAGPLINSQALEKVTEHVQDALDKGATLVTGGKPHSLGGTYFEPTLLTNINEDMQLNKEETFGPVAPLFKFSTEEEIINKANDTIFGLAAYFYTNDLKRTYRVSEALEFGIVGVNTGIISTAVAPFGGVKQSGLGREGSRHGMEEFLEMKYICTSI